MTLRQSLGGRLSISVALRFSLNAPLFSAERTNSTPHASREICYCSINAPVRRPRRFRGYVSGRSVIGRRIRLLVVYATPPNWGVTVPSPSGTHPHLCCLLCKLLTVVEAAVAWGSRRVVTGEIHGMPPSARHGLLITKIRFR